MNEPWKMTAGELAAAIRDRRLSSGEVLESHLARIDAVNATVNAVTVVLRESARAAAAAADRRPPIGPLHGVPFTVKENIDCEGSATTHGVPLFENMRPYIDAPIVARMRAAGAILIARTNMSEMGLRVCPDNPLRGRTLNPWNPALTAGGSSAGDAVALATGMTPFALGNDLGGSLRNPAYCCGVAALKPTSGRIPFGSSLPPADFGMAGQLMRVDGPMARSIDDLRLGLSLLAGRDVRDPRSVDAPLEGKKPERYRAALVTALPGVRMSSAITDAIRRAGALLQEAGWTVEHAEPPDIAKTSRLWGEVLAADFLHMLPAMRTALTPPLYEHVRKLCARFDVADKPNHLIHLARSRLARAWSRFLTDFTVVIGPTWPMKPWPVDADIDPETGIDLLEQTVRFITPGNVLGLPSVALPTGVVDGLPTGVQIYADLWREDLCLLAAEVVEAGTTPVTPIDPVAPNGAA